MTYKKHFTRVNQSGQMSPLGGGSVTGAWNGPGQNSATNYSNQDFGYKNYGSRLPEVYTGHPNRIERYNQYEMMDVDAEINACLDIISEFSTSSSSSTTENIISSNAEMIDLMKMFVEKMDNFIDAQSDSNSIQTELLQYSKA